jgi:hypothetical protein
MNRPRLTREDCLTALACVALIAFGFYVRPLWELIAS